MIGGIVTEVIPCGERVWINCMEVPHSSRECAIYVKSDDKSRNVQIGDTVWWQSVWAFWTPLKNKGKKCHVDYDIRLDRIGCSGVARPTKGPQ